MTKQRIRTLLGFYENILTNDLLYYWLPQCVDTEYGGFYNCYDNTGEHLLSTDKYTWSQGRFVWLWLSLADIKSDTFTKAEKNNFLQLAEDGIKFLAQHSLIGPDDWRCVYLTDAAGNPKQVGEWQDLDMSIYVDCFVINAFAKHARLHTDDSSWNFAKNLYLSVRKRLKTGNYHTLPYPLPDTYRAHGIPMIMSNVNTEMYEAASILEPSFAYNLLENLQECAEDIFQNFTDENYLLREIIGKDNHLLENLLGEHINPGHTLEDMWFQLDAMHLLNRWDYLPTIEAISHNALQLGWDNTYGGLFHYASLQGGPLEGTGGDVSHEPVLQYALKNTTGKIWWVHAEALYATLRLYFETNNVQFLEWYERIETYTFDTFPNPDREIKEWIQTRDQQGTPKKDAVGLPVKDPYHIMRSVILIIELLYRALAELP